MVKINKDNLYRIGETKRKIDKFINHHLLLLEQKYY
jgi:hypothetical protein